MLLLDTGLMLRLLNMTTGDISELTEQILTSDVTDLVNKGPMAEMLAGLELLHYRTPNIRHEIYYWQRQAKNSQAEVDRYRLQGCRLGATGHRSGKDRGRVCISD